MEFLRFGGRFPGLGVGCCAFDVIQGFGVDPDAPASAQLVDGDSGTPCLTPEGEQAYLGPTYLDVFKQRLRIGTFYQKEMPCHAFLAVITDNQLQAYSGGNGRRWLAILKEHGFEFIRSVRNSVYSTSRPPVYLFGLFRNIGEGALEDPFVPPAAWTELPECTLSQQEVWDRDTLRLMTEAELIEAGAPVWLSGTIGGYPRKKKPEETIDLSSSAPEPDYDDDDLYNDVFDEVILDVDDDENYIPF